VQHPHDTCGAAIQNPCHDGPDVKTFYGKKGRSTKKMDLPSYYFFGKIRHRQKLWIFLLINRQTITAHRIRLKYLPDLPVDALVH
jgi:hypothetical protein